MSFFGKQKKSEKKSEKKSSTSEASSSSQSLQIKGNTIIQTTHQRSQSVSYATSNYISSKNEIISSKGIIGITPKVPIQHDSQPFRTVPFSNEYRSNNIAIPQPLPSGRNYGSNNIILHNSFSPSRSTVIPVYSTQKPNVGSNIPTYDNTGKYKGCVLIINNIKFVDQEVRFGAEKDEESLKKLFSKFKYDVTIKRDLTAKNMDKAIKLHSSKSMDISVVVIMSHGTNMANKGGYTEIIGTDGSGLNTEEIYNQFANSPKLSGKPKIFIFQCCRGKEDEEIATDATVFKAAKRHADTLVAYSTLPGFYSIRSPKTGTWYIQSVCNTFTENADKLDVESMLKIVEHNIPSHIPRQQQTSMYENRGFKQCFLLPKSKMKN